MGYKEQIHKSNLWISMFKKTDNSKVNNFEDT